MVGNDLSVQADVENGRDVDIDAAVATVATLVQVREREAGQQASFFVVNLLHHGSDNVCEFYGALVVSSDADLLINDVKMGGRLARVKVRELGGFAIHEIGRASCRERGYTRVGARA